MQRTFRPAYEQKGTGGKSAAAERCQARRCSVQSGHWCQAAMDRCGGNSAGYGRSAVHRWRRQLHGELHQAVNKKSGSPTYNKGGDLALHKNND